MNARPVLWVLSLAGLLCVAAKVSGFWSQQATLTPEQRVTGCVLVDRAMLSVHFQAMASDPNAGDQHFLERLDDLLKSLRYTSKFISPDSRFTREQPKDEFERKLLARFADGTRDERRADGRVPFAERPNDDRTVSRYYQPIFARKECLVACHQPKRGDHVVAAQAPPFGRAAPGDRIWKDGELMAVVEVTIPLPPKSGE